ncbi:MAG: tetratricopeptide repeat protein [Planctomycetaceae bacterium]|nr:tetratricopeptide repeat protein [Planctomycetaceae bacterium]
MALVSTGCQPAPDSPEVLIERGRINRDRDRLTEALEALETAIRAEPQNAELYYERALVYERADRLEDALSDYEQAVRYNPDWREALNNRAVVLARLERFDDAVAGFTRVLEVMPDDVLALRNRGLARHDGGDAQAALDDVDAALKIDPGNSESWLVRGNICLESDLFEDAVESYSEALRLDQQFLPAREQRAVAYERLGKLELARKDQKRVEEIRQMADTNAAAEREFNSQFEQTEQSESEEPAVE